MDIIRPNSSYPAFQDGLHFYTGHIQVSGGSTYRFATENRKTNFALFYLAIIPSQATPTPGPGSDAPGLINAAQNQFTQLGYVESYDTNSNRLSYDVQPLAGNWILHYLIIGTDGTGYNTNSEIKSHATARLPGQPYVMKGYVAANGVGAILETNVKSVTFAFSKVSTGIYRITSSSAFFYATNRKYLFWCGFGSGSAYPESINGIRISDTQYHITANRFNDENVQVETDIAGELNFEINIYPTT